MTTTRDLIQRLANALHDAAEDVGGWGSYASGYFQEKHDLPGNIAKIHAQAEEAHAYLSQPEPEGVEDRIAKLEADLERERLRLAACGVVAMADTPESAAKARDMSPEYHSASLADVIRQIDALMELRAALKSQAPTDKELGPVPEGLTDKELLAALSQSVASFPPIHPEAKALSAVEYDWELEARKARAAIAADRARCGRPAVEPVPEGSTDEQIEKSFQLWWFNEGSGMRPSNGEDQEEHVRRVSQIAWSNGAHVARWGCPAVEPPAKPAHNTAQDSSQRP